MIGVDAYFPLAERGQRAPYEASGDQDLDLQRDAAEAAPVAIAEQPWVAGTTSWEWWSRPSELKDDATSSR